MTAALSIEPYLGARHRVKEHFADILLIHTQETSEVGTLEPHFTGGDLELRGRYPEQASYVEEAGIQTPVHLLGSSLFTSALLCLPLQKASSPVAIKQTSQARGVGEGVVMHPVADG